MQQPNDPAGGETPPTGQPSNQTPPPPSPSKPPTSTTSDLASVDVIVEPAISWKLRNPFNVPDYGGIQKIEERMIENIQSVIRQYASRMEFDAFMSHRSELENEARECVKAVTAEDASPKPPKLPKAMIGIGVAATFVFATIPFLVPVNTPGHLDIVVKILLSFIGLGVGLAGFTTIKPASTGILMMFQRRMPFIAGEGSQWALWPIMDFMVVETHERHTKLEGDKAFEVTAGNDEKAGKEVPHGLKQEVDKEFFAKVVEITRIRLPKIRPKNPAIMEAREEIEIERALSEAQDIDVDRMMLRVERLKKKNLNMPEDKIWDIVLAQENLLVRRMYEVTGQAGSGSFAGSALPVVDALREDRQEGQGQSRHNKRSGKNRRRN